MSLRGSFIAEAISNTVGETASGKDKHTIAETVIVQILFISSISCALSNVFIPLLVWSWKKKHSYKINQHERQVLNFQITVTLMLFAALSFLLVLPGGVVFLEETHQGASDLFYTGLITLGLMPVLLIEVFSTYQAVVNASRALSDKPIHYRFSIPIVK